MRRLRRQLVICFTAIVIAYVGIVLLLVWQQDALVFPGAGRGDRGCGDLPAVRVVELVRSQGLRFRIAIAQSKGAPRAVAVLFVGNGEDLLSGANAATEMAEYEMEVIAVEHPGYGASQGLPSVASLLDAASVAGAYARVRADELHLPLVAIGTSLGSFCAVHVAAEGRCDRLLLRAPPASLLAAARARFWWLPVRLVLRHRFDNLGQAKNVRCPAMVVHGDQDRIVPLEQGAELVAAFAGPSQLVVAQGYEHNNVPWSRRGPLGDRIAAFLKFP
jgi:hypothetical protein